MFMSSDIDLRFETPLEVKSRDASTLDVRAIAYSSDGQRVVSGSTNGIVKLCLGWQLHMRVQSSFF